MSPAKPTRDDATGASHPEEMYSGDGQGGDPPQWARQEPGRQRGDDAEPSNRLHPPHVTENDDDAPLQDEQSSPSDVAALPANASGQDEIDEDDLGGVIRRESAYDGRPEEDKDQPPSRRARE